MSGRDARALERAKASFLRWTNEYGVLVQRHVEQWLDDDADVEMNVQEVWRIAWAHALDGGQANLRWLLRVVDNVCRDEGRRRDSRESVHRELTLRLTWRAGGVDELDRLALAEALHRLTDLDRRIVALTYWDQLSAGEIAETLGMSQAAVRQRLHRATRKLQALLADVNGGDLIDR